MRILTVISLTLLLQIPLFAGNAAQGSYTNPILQEAQDPKVAFKDGYYYYMRWSYSGDINLMYRTRDLGDLGEPIELPGTPLTAPIFIETLNGHELNKWYLFGWNILESDGDPYDGNWTEIQRGFFEENEQYRLDYYSFFFQDELFMFWAGNERMDRNDWWFESIFASKVTFDGETFRLEQPQASHANMIATYSFGPGDRSKYYTSDVVVEAPAVYTPSQFGIEGRENELFMLLALHGAQTNHYSVGMMVFTGSSPDEVTHPSKWRKVYNNGNERLFASHDKDGNPTSLAAKGIKGPGVAALAPGPGNDGLWMYYHSKHKDNFSTQDTTNDDWRRRIMLQEIGWRTWEERLIPDFFARPIVGVGETGLIPNEEKSSPTKETSPSDHEQRPLPPPAPCCR